MADDEKQIRTLIERWAEAVHSGDMSGVLAGPSEDIVMFDVPPPYQGVRGLDSDVSTTTRRPSASTQTSSSARQ